MRKRLLVLLVLLLPAPLAAQEAEEAPRAEVGVFYEYQRDVNSDLNLHGFGGRFTGNLNRWLALETTLGIDPSRGAVPVRFIHQEFAAKLTYRRGRGGVFGFVGPGYNNARAFGFSDTRPTLKWGGGLEFYPSKHVGFRVDAGGLTTFFPGSRTSNFLLQPGISFRF
ncbi:MAG: outer membrane beta-barrel protein [Acidobacteria bacterium]|nr:outer membrane beta-barrel protein [Acidobacteriota bacterium]